MNGNTNTSVSSFKYFKIKENDKKWQLSYLDSSVDIGETPYGSGWKLEIYDVTQEEFNNKPNHILITTVNFSIPEDPDSVNDAHYGKNNIDQSNEVKKGDCGIIIVK